LHAGFEHLFEFVTGDEAITVCICVIETRLHALADFVFRKFSIIVFITFHESVDNLTRIKSLCIGESA
jgi:hypothetical protein